MRAPDTVPISVALQLNPKEVAVVELGLTMLSFDVGFGEWREHALTVMGRIRAQMGGDDAPSATEG